MVSLSETDKAITRFHLGYNAFSPSGDRYMLEYAMTNIADTATKDRIIQLIKRCDAAFNNTEINAIELYTEKETNITGKTTRNTQEKQQNSYQTRLRYYQRCQTILANIFGVRNLSDITEQEPKSSEPPQIMPLVLTAEPAVWRVGSDVPANSLGEDGDLFIDNTTGLFYLREFGAYVSQGSLKGPDGSIWRSGSSIPANSLGLNGDYYLRTIDGNVYVKSTGTYSITANIKGQDGSVAWRVGTGVPDNSLGVNNDLYLRSATGDVYQKAAGAYSIVANIKGAKGDAGTSVTIWRNGATVPANSLGSDGDYYLKNDTGDVYLKTAGTYSVVANIKGATGSSTSTWRTGTTVPANSLGANGDFYLKTNSGDVYEKAAGTYSLVANLKGAPGAASTTWRNGSTVPDNSLGVSGDYYVKNDTGDVYRKSGSVYTVVGNITPTTAIAIQDEGSPLGTGQTFNFVGSGVTTAIAGSVVTITIAGGGGDGGGGGSSATIEDFTITTANLAAGASVSGTLVLPVSNFFIQRLQSVIATTSTGSPARIRFYNDSASRNADVSRTTTTPVSGHHNCFCDQQVFNSDASGIRTPELSPTAKLTGGNLFYNIRNDDTVTRSLTITIKTLHFGV